MQKVKDAIKLLLDNDIEVVRNSHHLYHNNKGGYTILVFDKNSNLIWDEEAEFEKVDEAIEAFVKKAITEASCLKS